MEKAGVSESDLSVAVIKIEGDNLQKHYDFIKDKLGSKNSIYELQKDQIAVALKGSGSSKAIADINSLLIEGKENDLSMTVGLSSMSNRRVGENRLMGEAMKALDKANESSKEMLAFKPDPDKYKDFIKNS